jgi:hypothetical protein
MPLKKPIDDLRSTTLAAIHGTWEKLMYFARLRQGDPRKYSHWGFENKYKDEAQKALSKAHADTFRDLLRSPVSQLVDDVGEAQLRDELLNKKSTTGMVPLHLEGQSTAHFQYLLLSVRKVLRAKKSPQRE